MQSTTITGRRILSLKRHLAFVPAGAPITLAVRVTDDHRPRLKAIGLGSNPQPGDTALPTPIGPVTLFNAEGKYLPLKNLPKETVYHQRLWARKTWHGKLIEDYVTVPHVRYQRKFVPPPQAEMRCVTTEAGQLLAVIDGGANLPANEDALLHRINLMLEVFGEVELRQPDLTPFAPIKQRRIDWEILPAGQYPWEKTRQALASAIERFKDGKRAPIPERFDVIGRFGPDFTAVGQAGFSGYVVFAFERIGIYVLESAFYGNATYILDEEWERLSQMTKAELLDGALHKERVIHRAGSWETRIRELLTPALAEQAA